MTNIKEGIKAWRRDAGASTSPGWGAILLPLAALGLFAIVALPLSLWDGPLDPRKVGTLGEWAAGIGTVAAVCVAVWVVRKEREMLDLDISDRAHANQQSLKQARAEAQRALAAGVVSHFDVNNNTPTTFCAVWVNVFSPDPLRSIRIAVRWPSGSIVIPANKKSEDEGVKQADGDPGLGVYEFAHLDPGERKFCKHFHLNQKLAGVSPSVEIRWFDRWDDEWRMVPGRAPVLIPDEERRPLPAP